MFSWKTIGLIILVALVFGALMGYRSSLPFAWQRAVFAGLAFVVLGWLFVYLKAARK
jgi:hypothetical protein